MVGDVATEKVIPHRTLRRIAIYLLLLGMVAAMGGLAIYVYIAELHVSAFAPAPVQPPAIVIERKAPPPRVDYAGRIAFKCDLRRSDGLCLMDPESGDVAPLADASLYEAWKAREPFSPDGSRVAFSRRVGEGYDIFIRDVRGGWVDQCVVNSGTDHQPAWSPDGSLLAHVSQDDEGSSIWVYEFAQGGDRRLTHTQGCQDKHPSWSPDGSDIVFWSDRDGEMQLYLLDVESGEERRVGPEGVKAWDPVWVKPPTDGGAMAVSAQSPEALGLGMAFDAMRCWAEVSAGDSSGQAVITRVILLANGEVVHDSGLIDTSLYHAVVELGPELGAKQLLLQAWNTGAFAQRPKELGREVACIEPSPTPTREPTPGSSPTPTLTPIVVTPPPTPADIFAAATTVAEIAEQVARSGPPTATPPNLITATPVPEPFLIVNSPTPENQATAVYQEALATARAATTGTPTPLPPNAVTATPTHTPTPTPSPTHTPTPIPSSTPTLTPVPTATPVLVYLSDSERLAFYVPTREATSTPTPSPTNVPAVLVGKIAFHSDRFGGDHILVMDPDGSNVALLTNRWVYEATAEREALSPDGHYLVYQERGRHGLDLFLHDLRYGIATQLTYVGTGAAYDPAWSPDNYHIVFASNQEGDDEIFVVTRDGPVRQLTHNQ